MAGPTTVPNSRRTTVCLVSPDGTPYQAGDGMNSSVTVTGAALTALQAIATAIGTPADVAGANTVIGQLKAINTNTAA